MMALKENLYRGFSSFEYQRKKTFRLRDIDLVKMDLLNHIFTRRGDRVMMPTFGTRIPDLAFEPLDDITIDILREDLQAVVAYDPRVQLLDLRVIPDPDRNTVAATLRILYVELDLVDNLDLNIQFESAQ